MNRFMTPLNAFTYLICVFCLIVIVVIQYTMIQTNRGSAMALSYSFVLVPWAVLILTILFFLDRKHSNHFSRIFGIMTQCSFLPYFIYKVIFYYRADKDYGFYRKYFDEDHFTPPNEDLWFSFLLIILILFYSIKKITK